MSALKRAHPMRRRTHTALPLPLLLLALWLLACTGGIPQTAPAEEIAFDLTARFGAAVIDDSMAGEKLAALSRCEKIYRDPWGPDSPRLVKVGFELDRKKMHQNIRRAIHMAACEGSPCRITLPLALKRRGGLRLEFSLAGYGLSAASRSFDILITGASRRSLFSTARHAERIRPGRWTDLSLDLPDENPKEASLELVFKSSSRSIEHIFIAAPRIFCRRTSRNKEPNIVFISIDALRSDAVQAVSKGYNLTPNMDALASQGITCTKHFVVSNWTRPSTIAMLASAYAHSTGVNIFYPPVSEGEKEFFYHKSGVLPLSTLLRRRGYLTRSIGNNAFIIDYTGIGVDLDFDELSEYQSQVEDTVDITREAIAWIEKNRGRTFFLFINYNAPHNAYIPPERYIAPLRERLKGIHPWFRAYLGEVAYTDDYLGRLLDSLRRFGIFDNTIIVITSDHGEIFSKAHEMSPYTDVKAIFSHGQTQLDEELCVPLIIKPQQGRGYEGARVETQVRSVDIVPTILDLMGLPASERHQGRSILPIIDGKERSERIVYSEGRMMYSVRANGFKYAERFYGFGLRPFHWGGEHVPEYRELFDLRRDPNELDNLAGKRPDIEGRMQSILKNARFAQPPRTLAARGTPLKGRLRVNEGFFYDMDARGAGAHCERISRKEYAFSLGDGASLVFQTIPSDAGLAIIFERETRLLTGRYLLPLAARSGAGSYLIDPSAPLVQGRPEDPLRALVDPAALFWRPPGAQGLRRVKGEKYLSKDINRLLQRWGYIQGKEKKTGKL